MGARSLLMRRLRRWQQDWESWKQLWLAPLGAPLRRWQSARKLARIQRLERVEQLIWPDPAPAVERVVLFCHYSPRGHLQSCVQRLLSDLHQRGWQVVVISSGLNAAGLAWCRERRMAVLLRTNQGRDFGAFQDAWLALAQRGALDGCQQLVLLNDSVYPVMDLEATSWPRFLEGHAEAVVGFSDSFQNGYHLQSYALHIPVAVFQQSWLHEFWRNYPSWGGTATAIRDGEIGLSQLLLRHGVPLHPLHGVVPLRSWLCSAALADQLLEHCSAAAANLLLSQLLESSDRSIIHVSPSHQFAIPLLLQGFPFIKRDLLESNFCQALDPLLLAGGPQGWVDATELVDFLRPPIIGYKKS